MSNTPENDLNLDLHFLPAWAQQSPDINRYANFTGNEGADDRGRRRGGDRGEFRGARPGGPGGPGRGGPRPGGGRPGGPGGPGGRPGGPGGPGGGPRPSASFGGAPAGVGPRGPRRPDRADGPAGRGGPRFAGRGRDNRRPEGPPPPPLIDLNIAIHPDDKGVDSLARQIKMSGRAYPLFEIANMILKKPDRHTMVITTKKGGDGKAIQPLFVCALDESLWLSDADAAKHILDNQFATFYQEEKVPIDPPKGVYTFVAQCGMSGVVLGPPNHHDYQNQLRKLHAERFSRMPFDGYKARVRIVRDEAVVKKWVEDQSFRSQFQCLNVPEPLTLGSRAEVEQHFREVHLPNLVRSVDSIKISFEASKTLRHPALLRLIRHAYDSQRRFPLQMATHLSQQFASRGLQFFKVNKTVTHVAVARPHHLDLDTNVVSEGVRKIVNFINATPGCTRRQLFDTLMPGALAAHAEVPAAAPVEGAPADAAAAPAAKTPLSPELQAFVTDLHWLIHQGHVLEFATGVMETAKKPLPRPERPAPKKGEPAAQAPAAAAETATASAEPAVPTEASLAAEAPEPDDAAEGEPDTAPETGTEPATS